MKNTVHVSGFKHGKIIKGFLILLLFFIFSPKNTYAALSACSATISQSSTQINSSLDLVFQVSDEDRNQAMQWFSIQVPSSNYTITNYDHGSFQITNTQLMGSTWGFQTGFESAIGQNLTITTGEKQESNNNWIIQASDDSGGANPTTCTGDLGMAIIDPINSVPPVISNLVISDVTSSSVKITWTTDKNATSLIDYGITNSYGSAKSDITPTATHSLVLDGLTSNTTYHFNVKSVDSFGNSGEAGDNTFVAAQASTTATTTINSITIKTLTPTPSPTPAPDRTPPSVTISTDFTKPFSVSPKVLGAARDNKGVSKIEYSLDGGENYLPVDNIQSLGSRSTDFSFIIDSLDDGNYELVVRATDSSGNIGTSKTQTLVIDRLPPQVSGVLFSLGPQMLNPNKDGSVLVTESQSFKVTLSDIGGATSIDIFADDTSKLDSKKFSLIKNPDNGLWSGNIILNKEGEYQLRFSAVDGAGNRTDRNLNKINVVRKGKINATNAKITVYFFDNNSGLWKIWDGSSYGQVNPINSDTNGNYSLFLPKGKYYLQVEGYGFQTQTSEFFETLKSEPINADFSLKPLNLLIDLKFIKLYWPDFSTLTAPFVNNLPKDSSQSSLIGKQLPFFTTTDGFKSDSLSGRPSVLTFLNTWSPASSEQISVLNNFSKNKNFNSATIIEGEKSSKVSVFKNRGGYLLNMFADEDATEAKTFNLNTFPTNIFIDRKGIVTDVFWGVLSEAEITDILTK